MSYYGNLILRERLARSWSQAGLCKDICTVSYLSKIEAGKAQPSADVLRLLLARLGLHTDPALEAAGARCAENGYERLFTGRFGELAAALPAASDETYRATAAWTDLLLLRQFDTDGGALDAGLEAGMTPRQLAMQRRLQGRWDEALALLKMKKKGNYNIVQIDPSYRPAPIEHKQVFGITFEQGRNEFVIDENLLNDIVTTNHDLPEDAKRDLIVALIVLKYTQSNSVCYAKDGQAIGIGAGQQSRIHCTRLAGQKADNWLLRQHPRVLALPFVEKIARADRDNTIDVFISDEPDEVLADGRWQRFFTERPEPLTKEEKRAWLNQQTGVALGSDAFFPFGDNIERAHRSGVTYVAQPGGSIRDDNVIDACNLYNMVMCFTHMRLFHH